MEVRRVQAVERDVVQRHRVLRVQGDDGIGTDLMAAASTAWKFPNTPSNSMLSP
jgi:hypothetical protein